VVCDNPLCQKQLENQKYYEVVTSDGKLCVCNEVCENLAKFKKIKTKKDSINDDHKMNMNYLDALRFFQSTLSSSPNLILPHS